MKEKEESKKEKNQFGYAQIDFTMSVIISSLVALLLIAVWIG